jgi:predicted alpha-1,6-mannanase (GH76 family)
MKIATALVFLMTTLVSQAATSSCGPFPSNACPYKSLNRFMETTYKDDVLKNIDSLHYWPAANVYQALFDYTKAYHVIQNSVITGYLDKLQRFDYKSDKNEFLDDRAWLALAALRAYEIRPDSEFLNHALHTHSFMKKFWTFKCGGGVPWKVNNNYKNTITNALYLHLSAQLYRITKNRDYFKEAYRVLFWLKHSKLYDGSAFKDGLDGDTCKVNEGIYSYQIGEIVNGLVELYKASGGKDTMYLNQAKSYALNSLKTFTRQQVILEADK